MKKEDLIKQKEYFHPEIISIGIEHLNQCLELDKLALDSLWTKEQWHIELSEENRKCYGVLSNSKIIAIACGSLILDELQISAVAVHPSKRRIGLARKLLFFLLKEAKSYGAKKAFLEVRSSNDHAKSLYLNIGFRMIGSRKNFYRDGSNAIVFCCDLNNRNLEKL